MVKQQQGLTEALGVVRCRHAALCPEDREAEREEDEVAEALVALITRQEAPAAAGGGGAAAAVADHVPIDKWSSMAVAADGSQHALHSATSQGAMIACPRVDLI